MGAYRGERSQWRNRLSRRMKEVALSMRRILMVLSVTALMAVMMVASAGPVFAQATVVPHSCLPSGACFHHTTNKNGGTSTGHINPDDNPENTGGGAKHFGEFGEDDKSNCGDFCVKNVTTPSGNHAGHVQTHPQGK